MITHEDISRIKVENLKALKQKLNVNGVGIGHKIVSGKDTGQLCLTVLVRKKVAKSELLSRDLVPAMIDSIPVDVKAIGHVVALKARTDRWRPAPGGVSLGHYLITAGTLGAFVKDNATGQTLILSNNHVMANSNDASIGDPILQPGPADGGKNPQDRIADLERFVTIQFQGGNGGNGGICRIAKCSANILNALAKLVGSQHRLVPTKITAAANEVDAALAKPAWNDVITGDIIDIGVITGTKAATIGMAVRKSGRTTATTTGTVEMLNVNVDVGYGGSKVATFENQIVTGAISSPGDSGSLVVDGSEPLAVGLLFAGSDTSTVINPIDRVLALLDVHF
ncbi:MAG: S1 family peptidase [candidate division KSB1 bacterium]|nr:S1 family peptidase [candidate division KSB1 bacterium]